MPRQAESRCDNQDADEQGRDCRLCGTPMIRRGRDPLVRFLGFGLLYAAAMLLLIPVPALGPGKAAAVLIVAACGCVLMKNPRTWWCPTCWHSEK